MSVTTLDIFTKAMALIDEVSNGTIDVTNTVNYKTKASHILTIIQADLSRIGDLYKTYEISRRPITPVYGSFDYRTHDNEDVIEESTDVAKAYYFEINGPATVYIEDTTDGSNWNILETITVLSSITSFTAYKGLITPSTGAIKSRIKFAGDYYYNFTNVALFSQSFSSETRIPDFRPYIKLEMPSDFKSIDQIIEESYPNRYINTSEYKWEGKNNLYLDYYFEGNIRIVYKPIPTAITTIDDSTNVEIDDITALTSLPYILASQLIIDENSDLANYFEQKAAEMEYKANKSKKATITSVEDVYSNF